MILVGDGRRYGRDPIVLVMNNRGWEMLRVFQPESRFNSLDDWRFADALRRRNAN